MLQVGDIFLWKNYPYPRYEQNIIKDRWFLCLGTYKEDIFSGEVMMLIPTATTQLQHFDRGGDREKHCFVRFFENENFGFAQECVIDFDEDFYMSKKQVEPYFNELVIKGTIKNNPTKQQQIYNVVKSSSLIDRILKIQIRDNLRTIGAPI